MDMRSDIYDGQSENSFRREEIEDSHHRASSHYNKYIDVVSNIKPISIIKELGDVCLSLSKAILDELGTELEIISSETEISMHEASQVIDTTANSLKKEDESLEEFRQKEVQKILRLLKRIKNVKMRQKYLIDAAMMKISSAANVSSLKEILKEREQRQNDLHKELEMKKTEPHVLETIRSPVKLRKVYESLASKECDYLSNESKKLKLSSGERINNHDVIRNKLIGVKEVIQNVLREVDEAEKSKSFAKSHWTITKQKLSFGFENLSQESVQEIKSKVEVESVKVVNDVATCEVTDEGGIIEGPFSNPGTVSSTASIKLSTNHDFQCKKLTDSQEVGEKIEIKVKSNSQLLEKTLYIERQLEEANFALTSMLKVEEFQMLERLKLSCSKMNGEISEYSRQYEQLESQLSRLMEGTVQKAGTLDMQLHTLKMRKGNRKLAKKQNGKDESKQQDLATTTFQSKEDTSHLILMPEQFPDAFQAASLLASSTPARELRPIFSISQSSPSLLHNEVAVNKRYVESLTDTSSSPLISPTLAHPLSCSSHITSTTDTLKFSFDDYDYTEDYGLRLAVVQLSDIFSTLNAENRKDSENATLSGLRLKAKLLTQEIASSFQQLKSVNEKLHGPTNHLLALSLLEMHLSSNSSHL